MKATFGPNKQITFVVLLFLFYLNPINKIFFGWKKEDILKEGRNDVTCQSLKLSTAGTVCCEVRARLWLQN